MAATLNIITDRDKFIELELSETYFYCVKITNQSGEPILGATVTFKEKNITERTDSNGLARVTASSQDPYVCNIAISAMGYDNKDATAQKFSTRPILESDIQYTIVKLSKSAGNTVYCFKIKVTNSSGKIPITGLTKENISVAQDVQFDLVEEIGTGIYIIKCINSELTITIKNNGYLESTQTITGEQNIKDVKITQFNLRPTIEAVYYYVVKTQTESGNPISGVTVQIGDDTTQLITDQNGLAFKELGKKAQQPQSKNVYVIKYPSGYYIDKENNEDVGLVGATISKTIPGYTFNFKSNSNTTYNHSLIIFDYYTGVVVEDATIIYTYDNTVIETKTSISGITKFSSPYKELTIKISKQGYKDYSIVSTGLSDTDVNVINLDRDDAVQIIYNDEDNSPATHIYVNLYKYVNNEYVVLGKFYTYGTGYIKLLGDGYYNSQEDIYISVPNCKVIGSNKLERGNVQYIIEKDNTQQKLQWDCNRVSVNGIKKSISKGNKDLKTNGETNSVEYSSNDFRINIVDPDSIDTYDIFASAPIITDDNNGITSSIDIKLKPDINNLRIKTLNRYSGYYNPIFKDILFYSNLENCPFSNVKFDYSYNDKYGKFGVINNMWYHKVNDNKNIEIINTLTPYYPLTGQYALAHKDYNIFSSNWDMDYYTRQIDIKHAESCKNITSMKDGLCMFGSKYLNTPSEVDICGLTLGNDVNWNGEWNDDWITNPGGCPGEVMFKEINNSNVSFYFFLRKRIIRFFCDKLKGEFAKYISPDNSFGITGLDDDIEEYVIKNILKLYKLEKIRVFVRRTKKGQHNNRITNNYVKYVEYEDPDENDSKEVSVKFFKTHGFVECNNITMSKENRDDFDRKIVYNLRTGVKEDFGFGFILKKI